MYRIKDLATEQQIEYIKETFLQFLKKELRLYPVFAPLFVKTGTGINDDLNGIEKPVGFTTAKGKESYEIVQSLAKWKRMRLQELDVPLYEGIVTRMMAVRPDETLTPIHSVLVDQWDWEMVIQPSDRNMDFLKTVVSKIYHCLYSTEKKVSEQFRGPGSSLPNEITFISAKELYQQYPDKTPREREQIAARKYGAIFISGIGDDLGNGEPHDGRAPDYDDWSLNGDIVLWHPVLGRSFEVSSMGIRVDAETLKTQLAKMGMEHRKDLQFHQSLLTGKLPQTIGGGIGQSRLAMFMLKKEHIGEVQYA
ncbi:MAG TPA: aspartate--ammonia ligase [Parasegetibacter sp.]